MFGLDLFRHSDIVDLRTRLYQLEQQLADYRIEMERLTMSNNDLAAHTLHLATELKLLLATFEDRLPRRSPRPQRKKQEIPTQDEKQSPTSDPSGTPKAITTANLRQALETIVLKNPNWFL